MVNLQWISARNKHFAIYFRIYYIKDTPITFSECPFLPVDIINWVELLFRHLVEELIYDFFSGLRKCFL